ncbi:MAG: phage recombination protein Bet [Gammaproteobacteria bacterium]|nr:phage recombination protein Bet [Gammaproteobacteria bacterium]
MADNLPAMIQSRGIVPEQWSTLKNSLFPGAKDESILMAIDYCRARQLDPMKKPCHIVPMYVKDAKTGQGSMRDVIMAGIYEYRTTAQRTGQYMGRSKFEYGPDVEFGGVKGPEWVEVTVYRWHEASKTKIEYPARVLFREVCALNKESKANQRWAKAPVQMAEKCCEASALRAAFPDELGGEHTVEEMEGRVIDLTPEPTATSAGPQATIGPADTETGEAKTPATASQLKLLGKKIADAGIDETDFLLAFQVANMELLPFDRVNEALAWVKKGGSVDA